MSACRICGLLLPDLDVAICEDCLANGNAHGGFAMLDGIDTDEILEGGGDNLGEDQSLVGRQGRTWNCINSSRRHRAPSIGSGVTS